MDHNDASLENWLDGIDLTENAPDDSDVMAEPVDLRALLLRRFTWDTMMCSRVEALLPKLGLTLSTPEGTDHEHKESHQRMSAVMPFEGMFREYALILSTVLTTAITEGQGITDKMSPEDSIGYAQQNAELILAGSRAMVAQLIFMGLLSYGPMVQIRTAHYGEHGEIVFDEPELASDTELPGQLSFDDVEPGSDQR